MSNISKIWSRKTRNIFIQAFQGKPQRKKLTSKNFNLLIITQFYPPDYAATGQLIEELANHLGQNNIQVNIFTGQPGYAFTQKKAPALEIEENLSVQRSKVTQFWSHRIRGKTLNGIVFTLRAAWYLFKNARQNNAVVLTTAPPFLSIIGYLTKWIFDLDYVCLIYDLYPDAIIKLGVISENNLIAKFWNRVNATVWKKSKQIIVLSETMKKRIVSKHPIMYSKISVIHNWADADWIKPLNKQQNWFARQHGMDRKFTVLYSGNLGRCHDIDTVLGAIKILRDKPIQFVFIGAGSKHDICRKTATELNLNHCIFLPYQDRANLPYSLTACDLALVTIAPGLEGIVAPSKVYGIMAAGKAIAAICESHSYLRQLITNAECGACFNNNHSEELAEFIITLASNPELAVEMGNAGRNYMEKNFTPQIIAQRYCEVLDVNSNVTAPDIEREGKKAAKDSLYPELL